MINDTLGFIPSPESLSAKRPADGIFSHCMFTSRKWDIVLNFVKSSFILIYYGLCLGLRINQIGPVLLYLFGSKRHRSYCDGMIRCVCRRPPTPTTHRHPNFHPPLTHTPSPNQCFTVPMYQQNSYE